VGVPAIRERMVASLANVSSTLAEAVAAGLGMEVPNALPRALAKPPSPEVRKSAALSLLALPGECGIRTRQIAIVVADGVHRASIAAIQAALTADGGVAHFVGPRVGKFIADDGAEIEADKSMENSPSVLFDALVLPDGAKAIETLARDGHTMEYLKDQFRHCKPILVLGESRQLLEMAGIRGAMKDPGLLFAEPDKADDVAVGFIAAIAAHRHPGRDSDPPKI
jgi:catalase